MKSVITYNPSSVLSALNDWDKLVGSVFDRDYPSSAATMGYPVVDIREEKERYVLEAELPGFAEKDVDIKVNDRILTVSSSKDEAKNVGGEGVWLIRERGVRTFRRSFSMPRDVDLDGIKASFKDGLLSVVLPKRPEAREKTVAITRG
ncbi:MAG: Hsp20/alpha crystallin family protein [Spirochaetes bacterium]|nr:Hsp20/alpha crystallin family protein [Spirochaetota bacterium]MBU1079216.1 Hsp20/alpha crystallin family protein [Spirochaetota bacterium]